MGLLYGSIANRLIPINEDSIIKLCNSKVIVKSDIIGSLFGTGFFTSRVNLTKVKLGQAFSRAMILQDFDVKISYLY